jgi:hypothetical protein
MLDSVLIWAACAAMVLIVWTRLHAAWRTARDLDAALGDLMTPPPLH